MKIIDLTTVVGGWCASLLLISSSFLWREVTSAAASACTVDGASYGNLGGMHHRNKKSQLVTSSREVHEWTPLIGVACADSRGSGPCYSDASVWSDVAISHGNKSIDSEEECQELCTSTNDCDVWTYWPDGIGIKIPTAIIAETGCDICPAKNGYTVDREKDYCLKDDEDCGKCGDLYNKMYEDLAGGDILGETKSTCGDLTITFVMESGCCIFTGGREDSSATAAAAAAATATGACELFTAAPENDHVLSFMEGSHITSPKTCDATMWLPFLESTEALPSSAVEDDEIAETSNNTNEKLCWVSDHSYGIVADGACGDADIIIVYAPDSVIQLGKTQGWWKTTKEGDARSVYLISIEAGTFFASKCQQACIDNQDCGGWEFLNNESCILKSKLNCSPTLARSSTYKSVAGVKGCVNPDSNVPAERNALDTSKLWYLNCDQPRCTTPHSDGSWAEDTFIPDYEADNACWYKQFTPQELYDDCAQDKWIVISGGSNTLSFFIQMVGLFAPRHAGASSPFVNYGEAFAYSIIDIVFKKDSMPILDEDDDGILYENKKMFCQIDDSLPCGGSLVFQGGKADWSIKYLNAIDETLAAAPYEPGATRLTVVAGQIWSHAAATLKSIEKIRGFGYGMGWGGAKVIFYGQAMVWYPCNVEGWCEDAALGSTNDEMLEKYRSDMEDVVEVGKKTCATDGYDCFFATHAYGGSIGTRSRSMIDILSELTSQYSWAHFIDYNGIIDTNEIIEGHLTASMMLPIQTMMWNTVCDGPAYGCPEAIRMSPTCWTDCRGRGGGDSCESCEDNWVCVNSRQCSYEVLNPVPWGVAIEAPPVSNQLKSTCSDRVSLGVQYHHDDAIVAAASGRSSSSNNEPSALSLQAPRPRSSTLNPVPTSSPTITTTTTSETCNRRVWCGSIADGWVIGILLFLAGVGVIVIPSLMPLWESDETEGESLRTQEKDTVDSPNVEVVLRDPREIEKEEMQVMDAYSSEDKSIDPDEFLIDDNNTALHTAYSYESHKSYQTSKSNKSYTSHKSNKSHTYHKSNESINSYKSNKSQTSYKSGYSINSRKSGKSYQSAAHHSAASRSVGADSRESSNSDHFNKYRVGYNTTDPDTGLRCTSSVEVELGSQSKKTTTYQDPYDDCEVDVDEVDIDEFMPNVENTFTESVDENEAYLEAESARFNGVSSSLRALQEESPEKETENHEGSPKKKEFLKSLGFARILASQHIVLGHLFAKGATADIYFFGWGYTWVPWFFVLSGYVLTHARLNSSKPANVDRPFSHVAKRLSTIFPMYAFGLFLTMILRVAQDLKLPRYDTLIAQSFLMQSWIPVWTENAFLSQCWFLSNLIIYWAVFGWTYNYIRSMTLKSTFVSLGVISLIPWLIIIVPALNNNIDFNWYSQHKWGKTDTATDIWTILLKFNPIFYFHVFLFGMLLAVLRHNLKTERESDLAKLLTYFTKYGAMIGYFWLILIFTVKDIQPASYKLSARLSILLPLQGIMMLGLSPLPHVIDSGGFQDPLARLFSYAPSWIGDMSYCQYVLQFVMYNLFPVTKVNNPSFFLYLWGASLLSYKFIQEPAAKSWREFVSNQKEKLPFTTNHINIMALLVPSSAMALVLIIAKASHTPNIILARPTSVQRNFTALPAFVRIADEAVDMTLNWKMAVDDDDKLLPINPSLLFHDDGKGGVDFIRTVRAHHIHEETVPGADEKMEHIVTFQSSIMLGQERFSGDLSLGFDDESIKGWGLDGNFSLQQADYNIISHKRKDKGWTDLCEPAGKYNEAKTWLSRKIVTGPEDPKLFSMPATDNNGLNSWSLTFSSFPPAALMTELSSIDDCKWDEKAVMQMYLAADGPTLASGEKSQAVRVDCGKPEGTEKNWIAFHHDGNLYYVYSIEPHVVVHARKSDGACVEQYKTSSKYLRKIALELRGSATATRYSDTEYMAMMHTRDPVNGYTTVAYTFQSEPPFAIQRISKTLPLHSRAFASSLTVYEGKILIGYGEADMKSRILVMSRNYLESLFDWC